jgi:hypothetical protein
MIFEWARKMAAEVETGQSQDSYGLVLAWQRGGAAGSCDGLVVYLDGEVRASSCVWPDESRGRLRPEALASLHQGYDEWKPLQQGTGMEAGRGRVPVRLTFASRGAQNASPEDIAGLQALAAALHRELAVRRGGAPPPQPVVPGGPESNKEAPAAAPGPSLLVAPAPPARLPPPRAVLPQHIQPPSADEDAEATRPLAG